MKLDLKNTEGRRNFPPSVIFGGEEKASFLSDEVGKFAHDLGNVLGIVTLSVEIALEEDNIEKIKESLRMAKEACERAAKLKEKLVEVANSKDGKLQSEIKSTSLENTLREVSRLAESPDHSCIVDIPDNLWMAKVNPEIDRVFQNLIINARQEMEEEVREKGKGGILMLEAENIELQKENRIGLREGRYICISVSDTGRGIPRENLPKIFQKDFTTKKDGTGLGLNIAQSIVRDHGGKIMVSSRENFGTTFSVFLPAIADGLLEKLVLVS